MVAFTKPAAVFASLIIVIVACYALWIFYRDRRRKTLRKLPLKPEWLAVLEKNVEIYRRLPVSLREELHGHIQVFLHEKSFEGCGGLELTDEMKITIAAQACLLLLNRKSDYYPKLVSILVYPSTFIVKDQKDQQGIVIPEQDRLGESWRTGLVVLAWDEVVSGALHPGDGDNVVLHEFAHQLDQENGEADGTPVLESHSQYVSWARVLSKEFKSLRRKSFRHLATVMDHYGATDAGEFFAVATETFFGKPQQMKVKHPELFEELKSYYKVDPTNWELIEISKEVIKNTKLS